ncbi:MAG: Hsp70 family protein [Planctomycetes bacterium]|nr:Hsp70 family protein [Planctomycetota bacterium]
MARLGVDFGTTNTVAVVHDRGVFSVVLHRADTGAGTIVREVYPSAILIESGSEHRWFGLEADRRFGQHGPEPGSFYLPSLKRHLHNYSEGRTISMDAFSGRFDVGDLLTSYLGSLAESIRTSGLVEPDEPLETVITWPANANGAQRHITRRCFREAGFQVLSTLNEPTASAIELADCLTAGRGGRQRREPSAVAVFDLGGGTFDASAVWIDGDEFQVLTSAGIENLGGDDFDRVLLEMFLDKLKMSPDALIPLTRHALLRQTRAQKETIAGGVVRTLFLNPMDFGIQGLPISMPVAAYYDRLRPMLKPAIATLVSVIERAAEREPRIHVDRGLRIYLVGGTSKLPLVSEMVAAAFPRCQVVLTDKPFTSVAMGAAICAMDRVRYRDVFARHFGLIRLRDFGRAEVFDVVFPAGTPIPRRGEPPLERTAWYHPHHNIGHLRYLECTALGPGGLPDGSVRAWSDVLFPYDPGIPLSARPAADQVVDTEQFTGQTVCEVYRCDSDGVITVELRRPATDEVRTHEIYQD